MRVLHVLNEYTWNHVNLGGVYDEFDKTPKQFYVKSQIWLHLMLSMNTC